MKLDHIGIAFKTLARGRSYFKKNYGFKTLTFPKNEKAHGVKVQFLDIGYGSAGPVIEIIAPSSKKSKINNFLKKSGEQIHHLAYYVSCLDNELKKFQKNGMIVISDIVLGAGHKNSRTIWLVGKNKELIELIEKKKNVKFENRFTK